MYDINVCVCNIYNIVCVHMLKYRHVYVYMYACICTYVCIICMYVYMLMCMCMWICMCMNARTDAITKKLIVG